MTEALGAAAIEARGLRKVYGRYTAVDDLTMTVDGGAIFGFLGPNGAGKTTTLRMLTGIVRPTSGQARVLGLDVVSQVRELKRSIGYLPQGDPAYPDLTALENVAFALRLRGVARVERGGLAGAALAAVGIGNYADRRAGQLSGGQRRLLSIAAVIAPRPRLVILDEPTAGLDPSSRDAVWRALHDLAHEGVTVFTTTHHMDEADRCGRLGLMHRGRLLLEGSPEELRRGYGFKVFEVVFESEPPAGAAIRERIPHHRVDARGRRVRIATPLADAGDVRERLAALGRVSSVELSRPNLEDVYLALVDRATREAGP